MSHPAKSRRILAIVLPLLILALGAVGFVALVKSKAKAQPKQIEERTWVVDTLRVEPQHLGPILNLYGQVEAPRLVKLSASISADVLQVDVREGQQVEQGALMLVLDAREAELMVAQRVADIAEIDALVASEKRKQESNLASLPREQALLSYAEKSVSRAKKLERQQATSVSALDDAERGVEQQKLIIASRQLAIASHPAQLAQLQARRERAQALLSLAELDLSRTQIRAPVSGLISSVNIAPGERARVGTPLLDMYAPHELEIRVQIPKLEHSRLYSLLAESGTLSANADGGMMLSLHRFSGVVNPKAGGIDALLSIDSGAEKLRLGQFLNVHVQLPDENAVVALPYEAVYGGDHVFALKDQRLHRVSIERVGDTVDSQGIARLLARSEQWQAGDLIIATQLPNAIEGLKVTARQVD